VQLGCSCTRQSGGTSGRCSGTRCGRWRERQRCGDGCRGCGGGSLLLLPRGLLAPELKPALLLEPRLLPVSLLLLPALLQQGNHLAHHIGGAPAKPSHVKGVLQAVCAAAGRSGGAGRCRSASTSACGSARGRNSGGSGSYHIAGAENTRERAAAACPGSARTASVGACGSGGHARRRQHLQDSRSGERGRRSD
jgi:hypothetical protein